MFTPALRIRRVVSHVHVCACVAINVNRFHPHKLPDWVQHATTHMFIHQDLVILHHQASL